MMKKGDCKVVVVVADCYYELVGFGKEAVDSLVVGAFQRDHFVVELASSIYFRFDHGTPICVEYRRYRCLLLVPLSTERSVDTVEVSSVQVAVLVDCQIEVVVVGKDEVVVAWVVVVAYCLAVVDCQEVHLVVGVVGFVVEIAASLLSFAGFRNGVKELLARKREIRLGLKITFSIFQPIMMDLCLIQSGLSNFVYTK